MVNALKKVGKFAEDSWKKLPWWARALLSAHRWYRGIKGVPALWAAVVSLGWGGAVLGFFGSLPATTQIMWGLAGIIGSFGVIGHFGAALRGRSGNVKVMSEVQFLCHARELSLEASSYIVRRHAPPDAWSSSEGVQKYIQSHDDVVKRQDMLDYFNKCHPRVMVLFQEAIRRGYATEDELEVAFDNVDDVPKIMAKLVMRLQLKTGSVGD